MVSPINTHTEVQFSGGSNVKRLVLEEDRSEGLEPGDSETFVRLIPSEAMATVTAVVGGAAKWGSGIPETIDEQLLVSGSAVSLRYYPSGPVRILYAKFLRANPVIVYDPDTNSMTFDSDVVGLIRIQYRILFDRYKVTHWATACGSGLYRSATPAHTEATRYFVSGSDTESSTTPTHDSAMLVAEATGWERALLEVSGPPCPPDTSTITVSRRNRYSPPGLRLEEDAIIGSGIYPFHFSTDRESSGFSLYPQLVTIGDSTVALYAGAKIRVYGGTPSIVRGVNCAVSSQSVGSGNKPVLQSFSFSGSHSQNLDYVPRSGVSVQGPTEAVSIFGYTEIVSFRTAGDRVKEVEWETRNHFKVLEHSRVVNEDEVVVVDSANRTIPCYAFCQAEYSADYQLIDMLFTWDSRLNWYGPAMVYIESFDGRSGSIELQPPSRGGIP